MIFVVRALSISALVFASGLIGLGVQTRLLPEFLTESKGMIGSVVGLDATLLALVLGLLIWTSHGLFTAQQEQLQTLVRSTVVLDLTLASFGANAAQARAELRAFLHRARGRLWVGGRVRRGVLVYREFVDEIVPMRAALSRVAGDLDEQAPQIVSVRRMFGDLFDLQVTMVRSLVNPVPNVLLNVVIGWSCVLFFGYGLMNVFNPLTAIIAALGALLVGSSAFLILELSDPYVGLLILGTEGMDVLDQSLALLETEAAPVAA